MKILSTFLSKYSVTGIIIIILFYIDNIITTEPHRACKYGNLQNITNRASSPDIIFYGITNDCQIFFGTIHNLEQLHDIKVNPKLSHCPPHFTKLHVVNYLGQISILVTMIRYGNNLCTLNVEFPAIEFLTSSSLFTYSLLSSIPYFTCSSLPPEEFNFVPSQSFMDPRIADVIHFVGQDGGKKRVKELQFQITAEGYLKLKKQALTSDLFGPRQTKILTSIDRHTSIIYLIGDTEANLLKTTCALDSHEKEKPIRLDKEDNNVYTISEKYSKIDSLSIEDKVVLFGIQKSREIQKTRLLIGSLKEYINLKCFMSLPFLAHVSMTSAKTLNKLNASPIKTIDSLLKEQLNEQNRKKEVDSLKHGSFKTKQAALRTTTQKTVVKQKDISTTLNSLEITPKNNNENTDLTKTMSKELELSINKLDEEVEDFNKLLVTESASSPIPEFDIEADSLSEVFSNLPKDKFDEVETFLESAEGDEAKVLATDEVPIQSMNLTATEEEALTNKSSKCCKFVNLLNLILLLVSLSPFILV